MNLFHVFKFCKTLCPNFHCASLFFCVLLFLFRHKIDENTLGGIKEMDSGISLPEQMHSMNAYIGYDDRLYIYFLKLLDISIGNRMGPSEIKV